MPGEYYYLRSFIESLTREHEGYPLWCFPSSEDPRDYKYTQLVGASPAGEAEPIDYRTSLPPVFDQGQRGSCVACALAWTLKAYQEIKQGDYPPSGLSAAFLYSMCKLIDGLPGEEGTTPRAAMKVLNKAGICMEEEMPYTQLSDLAAPNTPEVPEQALANAVKFRIQSYAQLCGYGDRERSQVVSAMRQALKQQGPFLMALLVSENFVPDKDGMIPLPAGTARGGHAVGIVGDLPEQEAFILRNSWGSSWGLEGYAMLPYAWVTQQFDNAWHVFEAWTAVDISISAPARRIEIVPGMISMHADDVEVLLEQPCFMASGNKLVGPIKELAEAMGYKVAWYGRKVILIKPN